MLPIYECAIHSFIYIHVHISSFTNATLAMPFIHTFVMVGCYWSAVMRQVNAYGVAGVGKYYTHTHGVQLLVLASNQRNSMHF